MSQEEAIAIGGQKPTEEVKPQKQKKATPSYPEFLGFQGTYCPTCEEKFLTDLQGNPHCPLSHPKCPRHHDNPI